jgi:hypothetical protein
MHVDVVGRRAKMTVKHSEKGGRFEVDDHRGKSEV